MQEVSGEQLAADARWSFVRHQLDPALTRRAWAAADTVVVETRQRRPAEPARDPLLVGLGPAHRLTPLLAEVAAVVAGSPPPSQVVVEAGASVPWPADWDRPWHWMTTTDPLPQPGGWRVVALGDERDAAEIDALLDEANPGSFARPGQPGVAAWLGVREPTGHGALLAVGALLRMADRTLHLRGVAVRPELRGSGVGTALSTALTNVALGPDGSGVATLSVFADNAGAVRLYERLGYAVVHTLVTGTVRP